MAEQQVTLYPPTREAMRLIFELALKSAVHHGAKQTIGNAYNYFEFAWAQEDQNRQSQADEVEATETAESDDKKS